MTRIADGTRTGHASRAYEYAIGFRNCASCRAETPEPPQDVLDKLTDRGERVSTIWPFEHWHPPGWMTIREYGDICGRCSRAVMALLVARGRESPLEASDLTILEGNVSHALDLAQSGLLAEFPPPPQPHNGYDGYRYQTPGGDTVFRTMTDYTIAALRARIREIRNALLGKPESAP